MAEPAHYEPAGVNNKHRTPWLAFSYDRCADFEAALDEHRDQQVKTSI